MITSSKNNSSQFAYDNLAAAIESVEGARKRAASKSISDDTYDDTNMVPPVVTLTPDKLLALYGVKNVYLIFVWLVMAGVWGLTAMPMMISAFLMNPVCVPDGTNSSCIVENGTMAIEFDLTDDRAKLGDYSTSAFFIGDTVGAIFLPPLSDKSGRRPILVLSMFLYGLFGIVASLSPEIYSFIILRFLQGLFFTGAGVTSWVLAYESIPMRLRSYTTLSFGLFWVTGYCAVTPLALLIGNWRWLVAVVSAPCLIAAVFYYFLIPESFHFAVSHLHFNDVAIWLDQANRFAPWTGGARVTVTAGELCANIHAKHDASSAMEMADSGRLDATSPVSFSKKDLLLTLLSNRVLILHLAVMVYLWTCDAFVYYGLSLFSSQLAGNRYVNFALMGLIEIPSYVLSPILLNRLGRRYFMSLVHFLATCSFFVVAVYQNPTLNLLMWLLGKFAIASAFTSQFVYSSELFPTVVRNLCLGVCSVAARLGSSLVPAVQIMVHISPIMPTVFFGACALIGSLLVCILPETLNKELPDSTDEIN